MSDPNAACEDRSVARGCGLTVLLHLLQIPLALLAGLIACLVVPMEGYCVLAGLLPLMLFGLSQLVYMVPAILVARRKRRLGVAKGLIIGAAVTFVLNGACWALQRWPFVF